jgi:hypothetical protein
MASGWFLAMDHQQGLEHFLEALLREKAQSSSANVAGSKVPLRLPRWRSTSRRRVVRPQPVTSSSAPSRRALATTYQRDPAR